VLQLLDLPLERTDADAQDSRRRLLVAARLCEDPTDVLLLEIVE
jgi:hypothetical protein